MKKLKKKMLIIAATYEVTHEHENMVELIEALKSNNLKIFATVTTRAEFFDFHRRLIMTEGLLDLVETPEVYQISERLVAASLDFDLGYATLSDKNLKDIFMPKKLKSEYRSFHFP
ncbi:MAG: hypothetical protein AB7F59_02110 [Bdellovibrionales bacterium]